MINKSFSQRKSKILLESGTNEIEIVAFRVGAEFYGINVAKVREIIKGNISIVPVPDSHLSVAGVVNLRGEIIPIVNLALHLKIKTEFDIKSSRIIIAEFNKIKVGFLVNEATRIHRLSWEQVEEPSGLINAASGYTVGVVRIEEHILFLLDYEKIAFLINPDTNIQAVSEADLKLNKSASLDRQNKVIAVAEDSRLISTLIIDHLKKIGYQTILYKNGMEAWLAIEAAAKLNSNITDTFHLLITDIEMPKMDGLHLISKIKANPKLKKFPCLVFSSMITKELAAKCKSVGAKGQVPKPEIDQLIKLVDEYVL
ncbi:MAG: two-component system chemotaxis response regulator CheV [Candidatus Omnitrophota bacterium]|jgi:two-component system chemotaxis response regulator CheV